jgi:hypothetical protein
MVEELLAASVTSGSTSDGRARRRPSPSAAPVLRRDPGVPRPRSTTGPGDGQRIQGLGSPSGPVSGFLMDSSSLSTLEGPAPSRAHRTSLRGSPTTALAAPLRIDGTRITALGLRPASQRDQTRQTRVTPTCEIRSRRVTAHQRSAFLPVVPKGPRCGSEPGSPRPRLGCVALRSARPARCAPG